MNTTKKGAPRPIKPSSCRRIRQSKRLSGRAGEIMQVSRELFERDGVAHTSISAIAKACHVTRGLLYYYFPTKDDLVNAVLDDYVEDVLDSVSVWNECRHFGDIRGELLNCVYTFRRVLYNADGSPRAMFKVVEELGIRDAFNTRIVRECVEFICADIASEYAAYHVIEIQYVPEMFALVLFGVAGLLRAYPALTDDELAVIISQTLRLDSTSPKTCPPEYT